MFKDPLSPEDKALLWIVFLGGAVSLLVVQVIYLFICAKLNIGINL